MPKLAVSRRQLIATAGALAAAPLATALTTRSAAGAAPMLGLSQPTHYRFKLGGFEVTTISDAGAFIDGPWPLIGGNVEQNDVDRLMRDNLLPTNKYRPGFTPMVVNTGKKLILFDTGNGARASCHNRKAAGSWRSSPRPDSSPSRSTSWCCRTATPIISAA